MFSQGFANAAYVYPQPLGLSNQEAAKRGIVYGVESMDRDFCHDPRPTCHQLPPDHGGGCRSCRLVCRKKGRDDPDAAAGGDPAQLRRVAAVLVGFNSHFEHGDYTGAEAVIHDIFEIFIACSSAP